MREVKMNHAEEVIMRSMEKGICTPKDLSNKLGKAYSETRVSTMIVNMARKGMIDRGKAAIALIKSPNQLKLLNATFGSNYKKISNIKGGK